MSELPITARFYQLASDELLDKYEAALDYEDVVLAVAIRDSFLEDHDFSKEQTKTAKDDTNYLEEEPEVGDMVFVSTNNHHARVIAISDDKQLALVKELWGVYLVPADRIRRVR